MTLIEFKDFIDKVVGNSITKTISNLISYAIVAAVGIVLLNPQWTYERYVDYIDKKHGDRVEKRLKADPLIRDVLSELTLDLNCDRAYVCEFHNGTNNLAGLPFLYLDMKYEVVKIGCDHVDDEYINFNLTRYRFLPYAIDRGYWAGKVSDITLLDERFAANLERDKVKYAAFMLISGPDGIIGAIGISYFEEDRYGHDEVEMRQKMRTASQKIGILLSGE